MPYLKASDFLRKNNYPYYDFNQIPSSEKRFEDGCHFRVEVPTVNSIETANSLLKKADKYGIKINRLTETLGIFKHTPEEIKEYVALCNSNQCQLLMSIGPRAPYDTSATAKTVEGSMIGYRLRGQKQVMYAIEDVFRAIDLGVRGFVIYDEGLLWLLNNMKQQNEIPNVHLKASAHMGYSNAFSVKILEDLGANSANPVRDLDLINLSEIRQFVSIPLDCHTDNPKSSGGFIRFYDAPEIVRIASPVHLKVGNSVLDNHGQRVGAVEGEKMAEQILIVLEMVHKYFPEAKQSGSDKK